MKLNLRKAVLLALTVVLVAGAPVFVYSVSDATGNSSTPAAQSGNSSTPAAQSSTQSDPAAPAATQSAPAAQVAPAALAAVQNDPVATAALVAPSNPTLQSALVAQAAALYPDNPVAQAAVVAIAAQPQSSPAPAPAPAPAQKNTVNGVKSETKGAYSASSVPGVTAKVDNASFGAASEAELATQAGMSENAKVFVRTWDVTEKGSPAAYGSLKAAADASGATMGPTIEIDVKLRDKKTKEEKELTGGTSNLEIAIPANFQQEGARYAVVRVVEGGASTILEGAVEGNAFKFTAPSGNAAYALIRYDK